MFGYGSATRNSRSDGPGKLDSRIAERLERIQQHFESALGVEGPSPEVVAARPHPRTPRVNRSGPTGSGTHGGSRKASISKGVDDLLESGWLTRKSQDEIIEKLQERLHGANSDNVLHVLKRRLNRSLMRIKSGDGWVWSPIEK